MLFAKKFSNNLGIIPLGEQSLTSYIAQRAVFYRAKVDTTCIVDASRGNHFITQQ